MSRNNVTQPYDLVIKNGLLVDPAQGIHAQKDVAFYQGKVVAVDDELSAEPRKDARQVIDATGKIVTPGLIDLHVHVRGGTSFALDPVALLGSGSTTVLDAGTYGAVNFAQFPVLASTGRARVYAFLSISAIGIPGRPGLEILDYANVDLAVETCQRNRDLIKGVKVLLTKNFLKASSFATSSRNCDRATSTRTPTRGTRESWTRTAVSPQRRRTRSNGG
jgi:dihydroorotase